MYNVHAGASVRPEQMVGIAPAGSNASEYLTWQEAQHYQAALSVDGFTSPDRLPFQMFTMSAIVKQVREASKQAAAAAAHSLTPLCCSLLSVCEHRSRRSARDGTPT